MNVSDLPLRQREALETARSLELSGVPATTSAVSGGVHHESNQYYRTASAIKSLKSKGIWPYDRDGQVIPEITRQLRFSEDDLVDDEPVMITDESVENVLKAIESLDPKIEAEEGVFAKAILGHLCQLSPKLTLKVWGKVGELLDLLVGPQ